MTSGQAFSPETGGRHTGWVSAPRGGVLARRALGRLRHRTRALGLVPGRLERAGVAIASSWISVGCSPDSTRLSYARPVSRDVDVSEIVAIDGTGQVSLGKHRW